MYSPPYFHPKWLAALDPEASEFELDKRGRILALELIEISRCRPLVLTKREACQYAKSWILVLDHFYFSRRKRPFGPCVQLRCAQTLGPCPFCYRGRPVWVSPDDWNGYLGHFRCRNCPTKTIADVIQLAVENKSYAQLYREGGAS